MDAVAVGGDSKVDCFPLKVRGRYGKVSCRIGPKSGR